MELTPFEKAALMRERQALLSSTIAAASDLVELLNESSININAFRNNLRKGIKSTLIEREITAQAMRDSKNANAGLIILADTLEQTFGISA